MVVVKGNLKNTSDSNNGAKLFQADSRLGAAPRSRLPGIYSFVYRLRGVPWRLLARVLMMPI